MKKVVLSTITIISSLFAFIAYYGLNIYHVNTIDGVQLNFLGTIIGSCFGFLGIFITILFTIDTQKKEEEKKGDEERRMLSIKYRPILQFESKNHDFVIEKKSYNDFDNDNFNQAAEDNSKIEGMCNIDIILKNIGRGEIHSGEIRINKNSKYISVSYNRKINDIFPGDKIEISFSVHLKDYDKWLYESFDEFLEINITYFDWIGAKASISIPINIENVECNMEFDNNTKEAIIVSNNSTTCYINNIIRKVPEYFNS